MVLLTFLPSGADAQVPEPGDTIDAAADTAAARPDTLPGPPAADTVPADTPRTDTLPPVQLIELPEPVEAGWANGVWVWDREELLGSTAISVLDLIERIPSVTALRSGVYGVPSATSGPGVAAAGAEILLDGYPLDPHAAAAFDLSRIELVNLQRVRVERRLDGVRIELTTLDPRQREPYTIIEAAAGDIDTEALRGAFLTPRFLGGPFGLALDRLESGGTLQQQAARQFNGWIKYGIVGERSGVQLEYRRASIEREAVDAVPAGEASRSDLVLRGRSRLADGLVAELFAGRSKTDDTLRGDTLAFDETSVQAGARAGWRHRDFWSRATARYRNGAQLPRIETHAEVGIRPLDFVRVSGSAAWESWPEGGSGFSGGARAVAGPFYTVRVFAAYRNVDEGVPFLIGDGGEARFVKRSTLRGGVELGGEDAWLGVAAFRVDADSVAPVALPGFPADRARGSPLLPGTVLSGIEASGRVVAFWDPLSLHANVTSTSGAADTFYEPERSGRIGLTYHDLPLDSENLEIFARVEGEHRGALRTPGPDGVSIVIPSRTSLNFHLQIRVARLRAFLRWENITHDLDQFSVTGRRLPGQRVFYGVKWELLN